MWNDRDTAVGMVALWGQVIEAERGFRAELAYPIRLIVLPTTPIATVRGLEQYGVPIDISAMPQLHPAVPVWPSAPLPPPATVSQKLSMNHWWTVESCPQPNLMYRWQLPMGMMYRMIAVSANAEKMIRDVELVANVGMQLVRAPLKVLERDLAGNFLIYNGIRDNTMIDTRKMMQIEVRAVMDNFIGPPEPIVIGLIAHV